VDFRHPVEAVIPGVQGRILGVLSATTAQLSLRTVARLALASPAQVSRVLAHLTQVGIVERREAPPSSLFRLAHMHVAAPLILGLSHSPSRVLREIGTYAATMCPAPSSIIVFGSVARGEADIRSDLDAVVVRPVDVPDTEEWGLAVEEWRSFAATLTGNPVAVLEILEADLAGKLNSDEPLWSGVVRDGVVVHGPSLESLRQQVRA